MQNGYTLTGNWFGFFWYAPAPMTLEAAKATQATLAEVGLKTNIEPPICGNATRIDGRTS